MAAQEFITKFHNLDGVTVGQRTKNFYFLLNENKNLESNILDEIVTNLQPKNHREEVFYIELLIFYKRFDELLQKFLNHHNITIRKLAKQRWFFERAFQPTDADKFVNEFLPTLSYGTRLKVLYKLQCDEAMFDQIFDKVAERYGLSIAINILVKCSSQKISQVLPRLPKRFNNKILKALFDKDKNLIKIYCEQINRYNKFDPWSDFWQYVALKDPELYYEIHKKYTCTRRLGARASKSFITNKKDEILAKPKDFENMFRADVLIKTLGPDFEKFFKAIFPRTINGIRYFSNEYLDHYPKNHRFDLFERTFNSIFYQKLDKNLDLFECRLIDMITDCAIQECYASELYKLDSSKDFYLKYYKPNNCLEIIKSKLNFGTFSTRSKYIEILTECCIRNKDVNVFVKVLELVEVRLKNDGERLRIKFLRQVFDNPDFLKLLSETEWKKLYNLVELIIMSDTVDDYDKQTFYFYRLRFIEHLFNNNQSIDNFAEEIGITIITKLEDYQFKEFNKNPKFQKEILSRIISKIPDIPDDIKKEKLEEYLTITKYAFKYNKLNSEDKIDIHKLTMQLAKKLLDDQETIKPCSSHYPILKYALKHSEDFYNKNYLKYLADINATEVLLNLFWFKPDLIQTNFDEFEECVDFNSKESLRIIKNLCNLNLDRKYVEKALASLDDEDSRFTNNTLIEALALLMSPDEYLEFAKQYKPEAAKVDLNDRDTNKKYKLQCKVLSETATLETSPEKVLPFILEFCAGDYLSHSLRPLYKFLTRVPENQLDAYLQKFKDTKAISVRKHGTILTIYLCDRKKILECLQNSDLPLAMRYIFKYFIKNPDDDFSKLLKEKIDKAKEIDQETLNVFITHDIPQEHQDELKKVLWKSLKSTSYSDLKNQFLSSLQTDDPEFCNELAKDFMDFPDINQILVKSLTTNSNSTKVDTMVEIWKKLKSDYWWDPKKEVRIRERLRDFISNFCSAYMDKKTEPEIAEEFTKKLLEIFEPHEMCHQYIELSLTTLRDKSEKDLVMGFLELKDKLLETFGESQFNLIVDSMRDKLHHFHETEDEKFQFCYEIFKNKRKPEDIPFVIKMLPHCKIETKDSYEDYNDLRKAILEQNDKMVLLHYNLYLMDVY